MKLEYNDVLMAACTESELQAWERLSDQPLDLDDIVDKERDTARAIAALIWARQMRHVYGLGRWCEGDAIGPSQQVFERVSLQICRALIEAGLHQHRQLDHSDAQSMTSLLASLVFESADKPEGLLESGSLYHLRFAADYPVVAAGAASAAEVEIQLTRDENHIHHDLDGDLFLETRITGHGDRQMLSQDQLGRRLERHGLLILGSLKVSDSDRILQLGERRPTRQLLMIGNAGSSIWPAFSQSPEYLDKCPDPLDRWSKRIGGNLAADLGARAIYPWEGPPYPPFLDWAEKTGEVFPSPVSMYIHARYGLWHAYRFALALDQPMEDVHPTGKAGSPCMDCTDQPCLDTCPVQAFTGESYRVDSCTDYLLADGRSNCGERGCLARKACPVGQEYHYRPQHARFHMNAFIKSRVADARAADSGAN